MVLELANQAMLMVCVRLVAACTLNIKLAEILAFKGTKIATFASRGAAPHPAGGTSPQTPSYMSAVCPTPRG